MIKSDTLYGLIIWLIILSGAYFYYGIYAPKHPPKPFSEEIAGRNRFKADQAYREAHPEENKSIVILAAKYNIDIKDIQTIVESFKNSYEDKNKQLIILNVSKKTGIPEQTIASVLIDHSYLTSDCSEEE